MCNALAQLVIYGLNKLFVGLKSFTSYRIKVHPVVFHYGADVHLKYDDIMILLTVSIYSI